MKVSVIVPMYNAAATIERCVSQLLGQTFDGQLELLLVDDGSSDDTRTIAQRMADRDSRICLIAHDERRGAAEARNTALALATGEWVAFCDADDEVDDRWIEDFAALASDDVEMVVQGFYCDNWPAPTADGGRVVAYEGTGQRDVVVDALCRAQALGYLWCKFFRGDIIGGQGLRFRRMTVYEDEMFCLGYLRNVRRIAATARCNYHYRRPDFHAKYGGVDCFQTCLELFAEARRTFGEGRLRVKDMMAERAADWLIAAFRQRKADWRQRLAALMRTADGYRPGDGCRRRLRMLYGLTGKIWRFHSFIVSLHR